MISLNRLWLACYAILGLCFGLAMYQVMAQSRIFRREAISTTSTLMAVGIGVVSWLVFLGGGVLLGILYAKVEPTPGKFSPEALLVRVVVGVVIGAAIGATFYVPLMGVMGDLAVVFLDYHGVVLYLTGAVGGGVGAVVGAISGTPGLRWWIRVVAALGAGLGGLAVGLLLGWLFIALFTLPFTRVKE
jgi:hypothetical protein